MKFINSQEQNQSVSFFQFLYCAKIHSTQIFHLNHLSVHLSGIKYIQTVVQPSPPEHLPSLKSETLCPLDKNSAFLPPSSP